MLRCTTDTSYAGRGLRSRSAVVATVVFFVCFLAGVAWIVFVAINVFGTN